MPNFVEYKSEKHEASQELSLSGMREMILAGEDVEFPSFCSQGDPDSRRFGLTLCFGSREEDCVSYDFENRNNDSVFISSLIIILKDPLGNELAKSTFQENGYFLKPKEILFDNAFCTFETVLGSLSTSDLAPFSTFIILVKVEFGGKLKIVSEEAELQPVIINKTLSSDLGNFFETDEDTDISFEVNGKIIKAHKTILRARSSYFRGMFSSGMKEARAGVVKIGNMSPALFKDMIKFVYTDEPPPNINKTAEALLPIADQYLLPGLKDHCCAAIESRLAKRNVRKTLILAHGFNCPRLKRACFHLMHAKLTEGERLDIMKTKELFDQELFDEMVRFCAELRV